MATDVKNSRLMITKMVLENFKSYAGCQEIGPFHKRFSSIVGPNGSGKSNVIDALLFVFGKRAKQLRLNKVSELIHKSSRYPNLDFARVSVHFQLIYDDEESDDSFEIVADSEFVVTRTAFQNNQSKYIVDNRSTTYTDVGLLLRKHGIDLDNNRFLILQGEVEQIAMMKPKAATPNEEGLLEYLEDIIGSNVFVERIEEASKSLEQITEQRVEKVNRLKVAEKERDNLSGSKIEAEAFIEKEKDIRKKKNILYQLLEVEANENAEESKQNLNKALEKLAHEKNKLKDNQSRLSAIEAEYHKIQAEHSRIDTELTKTTTQLDTFERKDVQLQEDMKHAKALIKKQQAAAAKEAKKESDCLKEAEELHAQIGKYGQLITDYQSKRVEEEAQLESILEGLQDATAELRQNLEGTQAQLMIQEKAASSLQTEKESVQTSLTLLQARSQNAIKAKTGIEDKLRKVVTDRDLAVNNITEIDGTRRTALIEGISVTEKEVAICIQDEFSLQSAVREAVTTAELAKASLASQQRQSVGNIAVKGVLQAAKRGGPLANAGIRGRLGDLGSIAAQYDVAISTACGMLDYIVVNTSEGAQACINYLRDKNLGRASFFALDEMKEWNSHMNKIMTLPQGALRLFDLIQCPDAAVAPAFYMALRDTLVAQDLDQAVQLAYGEGGRVLWRVVTLDGNLIDTSGAMSGGGKQMRSGAMKLSNAGDSNNKAAAAAGTGKSGNNEEEDVTAARVAELEAAVTVLQQRLTSCRNKKVQSESKLSDLQKQLKGLQTERDKNSMAVTRFNEQETELRERLILCERECDLTAEEANNIEDATNRLQAIETEIGTVSPNLRTLQIEVSSLQRQIHSVGGPKLAKVQSKIDSYAAQLESFSSNLSTKQVEETNCRKQAEKAANLKLKAEQESIKAETKLASLLSQQKEMEADAQEVLVKVEASRELKAKLEEELRGGGKEYHELKELVSRVRAVEVDLIAIVERFEQEEKTHQSTAERWRAEAENVRKQHIDEQKEFVASVRAVLPTYMAASSSSNSSSNNDGENEDVIMNVDDDDDDSSSSNAATEHKDSESDNDGSSSNYDRLKVLPRKDLVEMLHTATTVSSSVMEDFKREISVMETQRNKMKSSVNMSALLEYLKKDASYKARLCELEQITETRNAVRKQHEDLRRQRLEAFMTGFGVISLKLKEMYQMITLGGDAELELLDSLDPFTEGIVFSVRPPRKSWKNISNLSGGEKTLSSLALVFALHHYKPTPLYVMDEIDAALDFKNVSIVANYIKDRTKNAQFVIISLRNNMFELADRLVGIYKTNDATKSVTINPKKFQAAVTAASSPLGDVTN